MTHDEARALLRKYYRVLEIAHNYKLHSTDIILAIGQKTYSTTSPQEREVVRRVSLLQDVQPVADAIGNLHEDYQRFIELRWGKERSLQMIGREMFISKKTAWVFEKEVLSAFIRVYEQN